MKHYTIYETTNTVNGKIYVGQHITNNLNDKYLGSGKILNYAIQKYGEDKFEKKILHIFETKEEMDTKEAEIVDEDFVARDDTYNIKTGGVGNWWYINNAPEYNELKIEKSIRGGKAAGQLHKDRLKTDSDYREKRLQMGKNQQLKKCNLKRRDWTGLKHSEATKKKMSESHTGKHVGSKNSQYGKTYIYNLDEKRSIRVPKEEVEEWIEKGWIKGRKIKFD